MSSLLKSIRVTPFYALVMVQAQDASDLPDLPGPGASPAPVLASTEAVMVATRDDLSGDVLIEVRRGEPGERGERGEPGEPPGLPVYDGELSFTTPCLVVGNPLAGGQATVDVGRIGWVPVKIYVDPPELPDRVTVVLPVD